MQTDYIDLFQIHWPDRYVPLFGPVSNLESGTICLALSSCQPSVLSSRLLLKNSVFGMPLTHMHLAQNKYDERLERQATSFEEQLEAIADLIQEVRLPSLDATHLLKGTNAFTYNMSVEDVLALAAVFMSMHLMILLYTYVYIYIYIYTYLYI